MSHSPAGYWTILGLGALVASVSDFRSVLLVAAAVLLLGMGCLALAHWQSQRGQCVPARGLAGPCLSSDSLRWQRVCQGAVVPAALPEGPQLGAGGQIHHLA